jgi:SNF2 family DNA or RNA helicase
MLLLVEKAFNDYNISYSRFDGTLSLKARKKVLDDFQRKPDAAVLLMTLGSGSVG